MGRLDLGRFFPYSIVLSNLWVWETTLTTLLLTLMRARDIENRTVQKARSHGWGMECCGSVAALTSPAMLSTLPFLGLWAWFRHWRREENCTGMAAIAAAVFLATVAPWIWRCSQTYGRFVAFRSNFGLEIMVGNSSDTSNPFNWAVLPAAGVMNNQSELDKIMLIGEPAYLAEKDHDARELVEQQPLRFTGLTLRRILYTWTAFWNFSLRPWTDDSALPNILVYSLISFLAWTGLVRAFQDGRDGAFPLAVLLVCFPWSITSLTPEIRFRHPIDPVIVILLVYGAMSASRSCGAGVPPAGF